MRCGPTVAFMGWFGPRGLASIVFAYRRGRHLAHGGTIVAATYLTVGLSVLPQRAADRRPLVAVEVMADDPVEHPRVEDDPGHAHAQRAGDQRD